MLTTSPFDQSRPHRQLREQLRHLREVLLDFLFPERSDVWLSVLRIGLGLQVAFYCLSIRRDWNRLFAWSEGGWINRDLLEAILTAQAPLAPRIGWLLSIGEHFGLSEQATLTTIWICLTAAACCLILGFLSRIAAVTAWMLHVCAVSSGGILTYGVDNFTTIGLFYLMLAPFPDRCSLDWKLWKRPVKDRHLHGFFRRALQLHLCAIYFFAGLSKSLGSGWWTGDSMWRALTCPPFNVLPVNLIMSWYWVLPFAGIAVCLLETCYPFFIWPRCTRPIWLVSILAMHIGIGLTMGLYLFALIMIILNLAAFGPGLLFPEKAEGQLNEANLGKVAPAL